MAKDGYRAIYPPTPRRLHRRPEICSCDKVCLTRCQICDQHCTALPLIGRPGDHANPLIHLRQRPTRPFPYPTPYKRLKASSYVYPYAETVTDYSMSDPEREWVWERDDGLPRKELPPSAIAGCAPRSGSRARRGSSARRIAPAKLVRGPNWGEEKKAKQSKNKGRCSHRQPASPITPSPVPVYDSYPPPQSRKRPPRKAPLARHVSVRRPPDPTVSADYALFQQERIGRVWGGDFGSDEEWLTNASHPRHLRAGALRRAYALNVGADGQYGETEVSWSDRRPRRSQDERDEDVEDDDDFEYDWEEWGRPQVNRGAGPQLPEHQGAFNLNDIRRKVNVKFGKSNKGTHRDDPGGLFYQGEDTEANVTEGEEERKKKPQSKYRTALELTTEKPDSHFRKSCKGRPCKKGGYAYESFGLDRKPLEEREEDLDNKGSVEEKPYVNVVDLKTGKRKKMRIRGYEKVPIAIRIFAGVEHLEGPILRLTTEEWEERKAEKEGRPRPREKKGKKGGCVVM